MLQYKAEISLVPFSKTHLIIIHLPPNPLSSSLFPVTQHLFFMPFLGNFSNKTLLNLIHCYRLLLLKWMVLVKDQPWDAGSPHRVGWNDVANHSAEQMSLSLSLSLNEKNNEAVKVKLYLSSLWWEIPPSLFLLTVNNDYKYQFARQ